MKNVKRIISTMLSISIAFSLTGCKMIEKTPESIKKSTVVKVNGTKYTRGEIDDRLAYLHAALKERYGEKYAENAEAKEILQKQREQLIKILIDNEIIKKKAKDLGIKVSDDEVNKKVDEALKGVKQNFKKDEDYKKALEREKLTEEKLKTRIKENTEIQLLTSKVYDNVTKNIKVDEKDIKKHYNENLNEYTEKPNGVELAHISVTKKEEADKIKKELDGGADFSKIAKEKSTDKITKEKGGKLGFLTFKELYQKQYLTIAVGMKKGQVSNPIQDETGFHIIKVLDKTNYPPKKYDQVKDSIKEKLIAEKKIKDWEEKMNKWREEVKPKTYEENLK